MSLKIVKMVIKSTKTQWENIHLMNLLLNVMHMLSSLGNRSEWLHKKIMQTLRLSRVVMTVTMECFFFFCFLDQIFLQTFLLKSSLPGKLPRFQLY